MHLIYFLHLVGRIVGHLGFFVGLIVGFLVGFFVLMGKLHDGDGGAVGADSHDSDGGAVGGGVVGCCSEIL